MSVFGGDLDLALAAARRGEERGFAELWQGLHPAVLRYLQAVAGEFAAEIASETWQEAAREVRGFGGDAVAFRVWLFRVARYRALERARKAARRPSGRSDDTAASRAGNAADNRADSRVGNASDDTVDVTENGIGDNGRTGSGPRAGTTAGPQATERALRLVAGLPPDESEAVLLRVVAGLDAAQAAMVLGVRDEAARTAAARGLRKLALIVRDAAGAPADSDDGRRRAWSIE